MNEMGQVLRSWLLGQLVRSAVVAVVLAVTLHLLGAARRAAARAAGRRGELHSYLGPLIAAFPIALVAMPLGLPTLAWVMVDLLRDPDHRRLRDRAADPEGLSERGAGHGRCSPS